MPHTPRIPEIPGDIVPPEYADNLRRLVAQLCLANSTKYSSGASPRFLLNTNLGTRVLGFLGANLSVSPSRT